MSTYRSILPLGGNSTRIDNRRRWHLSRRSNWCNTDRRGRCKQRDDAGPSRRGLERNRDRCWLKHRRPSSDDSDSYPRIFRGRHWVAPRCERRQIRIRSGSDQHRHASRPRTVDANGSTPNKRSFGATMAQRLQSIQLLRTSRRLSCLGIRFRPSILWTVAYCAFATSSRTATRLHGCTETWVARLVDSQGNFSDFVAPNLSLKPGATDSFEYRIYRPGLVSVASMQPPRVQINVSIGCAPTSLLTVTETEL